MHSSELRGRSALSTADWSDSAVASIYAATLSVGTAETQLIWARYAGFFAVNGFLITLIERFDDKTPATFWIGVAGLFLNSLWHIINFAGWRNQCFWYHLAGSLDHRLRTFRLPTDPFRGSVMVPHGEIYLLAQTIPAVLSVGAAAVVGFKSSVTIAVAAWLLACAVTLVVERQIIAPRNVPHA